MCGIGGIINFTAKEDMQKILTRMAGLMHYRGPDSTGIFHDNQAGLAHVRLSIIDLAGGDQPIHNEDRSIWVIFNGEIFNYPELRDDLKLRGHQFYTKTDTEVLVHLYEDYGTEMFKFLNGQFAFVIWDSKKKRALLGRDRMGIRPLFYYRENKRIVFGSEIKTLFADKNIQRSIDVRTLSNIFTCWSPLGDSTAFKNIKQIPPGSYALFSQKGLEIKQYWKLSFNKSETKEIPLADWVEEFNHLLLDATRIRLRADVPVGAYLSGGIDSTYISSLVKNNFNNQLCTFSVGFEERQYDESGFQNKAIEYLKTEHRKILCSNKQIGNIFPNIIWHTETPILRTAPAPLYLLSRLVRENNFKVVLTGEGADEIFAGYDIFKEEKVRRFWSREPSSKLRPRLLEKLYPDIFSSKNTKAKSFLENFFKKGLESVDSPVYSHMLRWHNTSQLHTFFSDDIKDETDSLEGFINKYISMLPDDFMQWHPLSRAQYNESSIFLSNYLLCSQGDRMTMANSVEGRYPFLDYRVAEFAAKVPPNLRMHGLEEKYLLKKAAAGKVPMEVIKRNKQPYRAPISKCFLGDSTPDYVNELLSEKQIKHTGYFDYKKVARLMAKSKKSNGELISERENMALIGILSTQLLDHMFIQQFPYVPEHTADQVL
jgi:asparagine synthase (glutamine-hydrolysing)